MGEKEAYIKKMNAQIREWKADLDKTVAQFDKAKAGAEIEYHKRAKQLNKKRKELEQELAKLQKAGEQGWEEIQARADKTWKDIQGGLGEMRKRL